MKRALVFKTLLPSCIFAIPWIYLAFIWNNLPATIPVHFGINGNPDRFGNRIEVLVTPAIITTVGLLTYFILTNIGKIDPKKKYAGINTGLMSKIAIVTVILLSAVTTFILYWTLHGKIEGGNIFFCIISLFMAYMGNLFHSVKPNYFAGFRLPWTLESEDNWRKTHQLASKIWFIGGILLAIITLVISTKLALIIFMSGMAIMVIIPTFYSYKLFRQSLRQSN